MIEDGFLKSDHHGLLNWAKYSKRWPNISPRELASRGNGAIHINVDLLDRWQSLRTAWGKPIVINSAYRDPVYNARVGGAPMSLHKRGLALDNSTFGWTGSEKAQFKELAWEHGFTGFGGYNSFIHLDIGRARKWGQSWAWPKALGGK